MNRKHSEEEHEKENGERWLLTYADMITLLLALFIVMYGISTVNLSKLQKLSDAFGTALNNPQGAGGSGGSGGSEGSGDGTQSGNAGGVSEESGLDSIFKDLSVYLKEKDLNSDVNIELTETSVIIHLSDTLLFKPDTAILLAKSEPTLAKLSDIIKKVYSHISHITITGNTADVGNEEGDWQLSVDRALRVLYSLSNAGLPQNKMSIEGNAQFKPIAPNDTEENRAKNRRVEITIKK
jgi:chemotaxis protein MotB